MKRMTTEQFIDRAIAVHGDRYDYGRTEYVSSREAVVIDCPVHGEFQQRASSHLQGNGCPVRATDNRRSVKRELDNNLRYVVFWDNNLSDAKAWLQRWIETHEI